MLNMQSLVLAIEEYTRQRLPRYIGELSEMCSIDSYSYHKPGLDEMASWLAMRMRSLGVDATIIEREEWGNDILSVVQGEGEGNVLLVGHTDTVYPVGTAAARPVRVEGNRLYGPGVSDMRDASFRLSMRLKLCLPWGIAPLLE